MKLDTGYCSTKRTSGRVGVASLGKDHHEVVCDVTAGQFDFQGGVRDGVALQDGHDVGHSIASFQYLYILQGIGTLFGDLLFRLSDWMRITRARQYLRHS